ncbi:hypothetical protein ABZY58_11625 [Micromonospora tulbaghiae]|uniref:hypothetical protein n=1 Tax=Micromonospora tulbaghiae TaxID=479978 RepID=UPI0033BA1EF4
MTGVRDEIDRYLQRMPHAREAMLKDPQYHWQIQWARRNLELMDLALDNEGVPEDVRVRVIRTVLYGTADEAEALRRIDQTQRRMQEVRLDFMSRPQVIPIPDGLLP